LGSLYTAVASFLDARAHGGRWVLRIEDLDRPREVAGSAAGILRTLQAFGFEWDGEIVRQSDRTERYVEAVQTLQDRNLTFECSCSRLQLEDESRYPGTCRLRPSNSRVATATRLRVEQGTILFHDRIQGTYRQDVAGAVGDLILRRRDQIFAYVLAVVVDDAEQSVTDIVRGADLLDSTARQIHLQRLLGHRQPRYLHVPMAVNAAGAKLSKQSGAPPIEVSKKEELLRQALVFLGQAPTENLADAIRNWDPSRIPATRTRYLA